MALLLRRKIEFVDSFSHLAVIVVIVGGGGGGVRGNARFGCKISGG